MQPFEGDQNFDDLASPSSLTAPHGPRAGRHGVFVVLPEPFVQALPARKSRYAAVYVAHPGPENPQGGPQLYDGTISPLPGFNGILQHFEEGLQGAAGPQELYRRRYGDEPPVLLLDREQPNGAYLCPYTDAVKSVDRGRHRATMSKIGDDVGNVLFELLFVGLFTVGAVHEGIVRHDYPLFFALIVLTMFPVKGITMRQLTRTDPQRFKRDISRLYAISMVTAVVAALAYSIGQLDISILATGEVWGWAAFCACGGGLLGWVRVANTRPTSSRGGVGRTR